MASTNPAGRSAGRNNLARMAGRIVSRLAGRGRGRSVGRIAGRPGGRTTGRVADSPVVRGGRVVDGAVLGRHPSRGRRPAGRRGGRGRGGPRGSSTNRNPRIAGITKHHDMRAEEDNDDDNEEEEQAPFIVSMAPTPATLLPLPTPILQRATSLLFVSHAWNQFSELAWQFALVIILAAILNYDSLLLVCTYGVTVQLLVCFGSPLVGRRIDTAAATGRRLVLARRLILLENICVLLATGCCWQVLLYVQHHQQAVANAPPPSTFIHDDDEIPKEPSVFNYAAQDISQQLWVIILLIVIHLLGGLAQVLDKGFLVAIERDWIVILSKASSQESKDQEEWLSIINVRMKQVDLSCQIVAPAITGWFLSFFPKQNLTVAVLWVGAWNILALIAEGICTARIYHLVPHLTQPGIVEHDPIGHDDEKGEENKGLPRSNSDTKLSSRCLRWLGLNHLNIYFQQRAVAWGGLGLALLYFNVLTFSGMMTAYLVSEGMSLAQIGLWRGISSAVGLLGTVCYHQSVKWLSLEETGLWSILFEFLCLSVTAVSTFARGHRLKLALLIGGVLPSRIGLWVYDIAMTQLMQQYVAANVRGTVGGTQTSLNAICELLPYILGIMYSKPSQFHIFVIGGYLSVGVASILYTVGLYLPHFYGFEGRQFQLVDGNESEGEVQMVPQSTNGSTEKEGSDVS